MQGSFDTSDTFGSYDSFAPFVDNLFLLSPAKIVLSTSCAKRRINGQLAKLKKETP
jgi:hypothetical protein